MSQPEQLHLSRLRIAKEPTLGAGAADAAGWLKPPVTAATVKRQIVEVAERRNLRRNTRERAILHQSWVIATSHEIGRDLLWWLIESIVGDCSDGGEFEQDSETPSFAIEAKSPKGDLQLYSGCVPVEIQILFEERKATSLEILWNSLERTVPESDAAGDTQTVETSLIANYESSTEATLGEWSDDPNDDAVTAHGGQIVLTRDSKPSNYSAQGIPTDHSPAVWVAMAEIFLPETAGITDQAFSDLWIGKVGVRIGDREDRIQLNNASGIVADENLVDYDWRVRRLAVEGQGDNLGAVAIFYRDNS